MRLPSIAAAGTAARRALGTVPRELARRGAPLLGRVAGPADRGVALERYRALADSYELRTAARDAHRRQTVERLAPRP